MARSRTPQHWLNQLHILSIALVLSGFSTEPPATLLAERAVTAWACRVLGRHRRLSEHRQVVAGLGAELEGHFAAVPGHQPVEEAPGSLGEAFLAPVLQRRARVGLLAPAAQAELPHHPFEELGHVVLQSR